MKKFIKRLIIFLIPILILFILLEYAIRQIPNTYKYKNEWMSQHADSLNTLILGNSHCMSGVNPLYLTNSAFNFANSSQDLERDYFVLTKYENMYNNLKCVILSFSYCTLQDKMDNTDKSRLKYYGIYMGYEKYKYSVEITSSITYEKIKDYLKEGTSQYSPLGFRVNKFSKDNLEVSGIKAAKRHTLNNRKDLDDNLKYLHKIIQFCEDKQIQLILVTTPTWHSYYEHLDKHQLDQLLSTAKELDNNHENVFYFNFLKDDRFNDNDFFGKQASLTVSGQLEGELAAMSLGAIYTFGPTFRAENSNTPRHLAEFWMIEPEVAFNEIAENMQLAEDFIKYCIQWALDNCMDDIQFLNNMFDKELIERLQFVLKHDFIRLSYTEGVKILEEAVAKGHTFEFPIYWGADLASEHERYLVEEHFKCPVILTDYPKEIKSFYMKQNDDGKTVRAMDVLFPVSYTHLTLPTNSRV